MPGRRAGDFLPSSNVGLGKVAVRGTTAYAAMRKQFGLPIGKFEGVQAPLARMSGHLYACDSVRRVSVASWMPAKNLR